MRFARIMHEASIAEYILSLVEKRVENEGSGFEGTAVTVKVGEFRNVDPESLGFAFDSIKGSFASCRNCHLEIVFIEAKAVCSAAHSFRPSCENQFSCPICGAGVKQFKAGEELDIVKIVITSVSKGKLECTR